MKKTIKKINKVFHVAGRVIDMVDLEKDCAKILKKYYEQDIQEVTIKFYIAVRGKYLYLSRYLVLGVHRPTNKWHKLNQGTNDIVQYAAAIWKYDHARSAQIEWNTITFNFDGYEMSLGSKNFDHEVDRRAKEDAKDGILFRSARSIMQFINRAVIGSQTPGKKDKNDEQEQANDEYSV